MKYLTERFQPRRRVWPLRRASRDFLKERPVSDPVFAAYQPDVRVRQGPLDAKMVETVDEGDWIRELVRMNAAYAGDTPAGLSLSAQSGVEATPGGGLLPWLQRRPRCGSRTSPRRSSISSSRAVARCSQPVYKGTLQRSDSLFSDDAGHHHFYRDHVIMWAKDLSRGLDYLETRPDLSLDRWRTTV